MIQHVTSCKSNVICCATIVGGCLAIYDIFISYSSKDRPWAQKLYRDLHGGFPSLRIFWDRESITAGEVCAFYGHLTRSVLHNQFKSQAY
jgi:hypothetical protein